MLMVPSSQGYGAISPTSPGFDEQAFFDDIIDQPLVAGEKPIVKQRKSWESAMSSNKSQRFVSVPSVSQSNAGVRMFCSWFCNRLTWAKSLDVALDSALGAWQRVKSRRGSYDKISSQKMIGVDWEAK